MIVLNIGVLYSYSAYSCDLDLDYKYINNGKIIEISVGIKNINAGEGITGLYTFIDYNPDIFENMKVIASENWEEPELEDSMLEVQSSAIIGQKVNQEICKVRFKIKENVAGGKYSIFFREIEFSTDDISSSIPNDDQELGIEVQKSIPGDDIPNQEEQNQSENTPEEQNINEQASNIQNPSEQEELEKNQQNPSEQEEQEPNQQNQEEISQSERIQEETKNNNKKNKQNTIISDNQDKTASKGKIEPAGLPVGVGGLIIVSVIISVIAYIKYREYKEIK